MTSSNRVYLFDTTLRDGAQTQGVDFTVADKAAIARELDLLGIDYIEGGWPGANPTDDRFFADPPNFQNAKFVAFGMTRRAGRSAANDPGLNAILSTRARRRAADPGHDQRAGRALWQCQHDLADPQPRAEDGLRDRPEGGRDAAPD